MFSVFSTIRFQWCLPWWNTQVSTPATLPGVSTFGRTVSEMYCDRFSLFGQTLGDSSFVRLEGCVYRWLDVVTCDETVI